MFESMWTYRLLIIQLTVREVVGRYKGSIMGLLWSFLNPLFMLVVYTFVFSVVFKAKWGGANESRTQFAIILFAGMIVQGLFADILTRSTSLVLANASYVKKVVFPLEILVVITAGSAMFHALVSIIVLLAAFFVFNGYLHWTCIFFPFVFLPLIFLSMGFAWIISSVGVFARDVGQVVAIFVTVLLFLSPVFFPVSALPPKVQPWIMANPLTFIIEQARAVIVWGQLPDLVGLLKYTACSILVAWAGYAWFQKTRKGFADVI